MTQATPLPDPALLAAAITALGGAGFGEAFLRLVQSVTQADLVSAFMANGPAPERDGLRILIAAGQHPEISGFAVSASLAYANAFWRRDRATRQALSSPREGVRLVRQAASGLLDHDHRSICYDRAGITERVTLYGGGDRPVMASCYRMAGRPLSQPDELDRLEACGEVLLALVMRHDAIVSAPRTADDLATLIGRFHALCPVLSAREATVAAGMALGLSQPQLASEMRIGLHSVVTYRRRAYRKLGITSRSELPRLAQQAIQIDNHLET